MGVLESHVPGYRSMVVNGNTLLNSEDYAVWGEQLNGGRGSSLTQGEAGGGPVGGRQGGWRGERGVSRGQADGAG